MEVSLAVGIDEMTTEAVQSTSTSRGSELWGVRLSWAVGLDGAVVETNRRSQEVKRRKVARSGLAATQEYEPYFANDHMSVQMNVDELVLGAASASSLQTLSTLWFD